MWVESVTPESGDDRSDAREGSRLGGGAGGNVGASERGSKWCRTSSLRDLSDSSVKTLRNLGRLRRRDLYLPSI